MKVKEVADLVGISVRTLHYYDEIGLLKPEQTTEAGYRKYTKSNIEALQQIMFFRALDVPLKQIKEIIHRPSFNKTEALMLHRSMLLEKRERLDQIIQTLNKTLKYEEGEIEMSDQERFVGFDLRNNPYEQEARERWGEKAVDKSNEKIRFMNNNEQNAWANDVDALYRELAALCKQDPNSKEAQAAIAKWYRYLNRIGDYTPEAFQALGAMYVEDNRFKENIDTFGEGLAVFMRDAMQTYAQNLNK